MLGGSAGRADRPSRPRRMPRSPTSGASATSLRVFSAPSPATASRSSVCRSAERSGCSSRSSAPERVDRLVLACTAARFGDPEQWRERAAVVRAKGLERDRRRGAGPLVHTAVSRTAARTARCCSPSIPKGTRAAATRSPAGTSAATLGAVRAPTLVIAGADDPSTPPGGGRAGRRGDPRRTVRGDRARSAHRERGAGRRVQPTHRGASVSHEDGSKVRREVLGDEHVDAAVERTTEFTADFQDLITRYAWGEIWARPGPRPQDAERGHPDRADRAQPP